jgi:membrane protein DedA with SNARE-associated domain/rhodanese-related sulfurtransferase
MFDDFPIPAGPLLIFGNVLATSLGLPLPALPTLLLVAADLAMHPEAQYRTLALALVASVCASLIGDTVWYLLGRRFGGRTLRALCSLSLSRDTCVRQTEGTFTRFGVKVLAVAKFIPGLSMIAIPLAGAMGVRPLTFGFFASVGAALWAGVGLVLGTIFAHSITAVVAAVAHTSGRAAACVVVVVGLYVAYRWWRRRSLQRLMNIARIDVDQLYELMSMSPTPVLFDVRSKATLFLEPLTLPGAKVVDLHGDLLSLGELDRHQPMVVYCSCPNEVSAAHYADRLRKAGFEDVHVLLGGLDAWRAAGRILETVPAEVNVVEGEGGAFCAAGAGGARAR